jgi:hypothetical protein
LPQDTTAFSPTASKRSSHGGGIPGNSLSALTASLVFDTPPHYQNLTS